MPGRTTGDNKFGPGPYVVGPILGDGVNYDTIQSAVNAAAADGYPVVYVRPNTYSENVVFPAEVTLVGAEVDGRDAYVLINGNCTTSGNGVFSFRNIAFTAAAGDVFFSDAAGGVSSFRFNNCYVSGPAGVVGLAFDASGGQVFLALEDSSVIMNSNGINLTGGCQATIEGSTLESGIAVALSLTGTGNTAEVRDCKISAQNDDAISIGNNSGSVIISSSTLMAGVAGFDIGAGSSVQATHCTLESNNGAGFWATGGGDLRYADMVLTGTALNIDTGSLNSVTALPWQQYAEDAAAGPGSVRGTASFNSADFTVVDGFVSAVGGGGASASLSPYIVGTTGTNDFATIQAAITQAVADGATDGNPLNIYVKPGVYNEALTTAAGIRLLAASWDLQDINLGGADPAVNFTGTIDHPTGSLSIIGFNFSGNNGATPIIQNNGSSQIRITGCLFQCTGTGPLVSTSGTAIGTNLVVQNCTFTSTNTSLLDISDGALIANFFDSYISTSNFVLNCAATTTLFLYRCMIAGSPVQVIVGAAVIGGSFEIMDCNFLAPVTTFIDASANANPQTVLIERSLLRSSAPFCILNNVSTCTINNCDTTFAEPCTTAATSTISNSTFNPGSLPIASGILQVSQTFNGTSELTRLILTDEFHGTYSERFHGVGQTVGLGSVNLATIPILTNEVVSVKCNVACNDGAFAGGAGGNVEASARRAGGGAILIGSFTNVFGEGSLATATIIPQVVGNNLLIDTVGIVGVTMNWSIDYEVLHVQSDA